MNKFTLFIFSLSSISLAMNAQSNCNNHVQVTLCPTTTLLHETNSGMGDDAPASINITGEDVVYEILAPNGAQKIFISISNANGPVILSLGNGSCSNGIYNSYNIPQGNSNSVFQVSYSNVYFLWVDASTTINYDISFGADTGTTFVNIPSTQGNLQFDYNLCGTPVFQPSKPFFQVSYNSVFKTHPMTLSPLNVQGTMCVNTFFKNTTGIEAVRRFEFEYDTLGFSTFNTSPIIPGFFLPGNWIADRVGNKWVFTFIDALGIGKGDFSGIPNTCLNYHFCFDVVPISNDPQKTNVKVTILSDGFGQGYNGFIHLGCCPGPIPNCLGPGSGNGSGNGGHGFGYGFADPGVSLPIELIDFNLKAVNDVVYFNWMTASEINNEFFTIEKSKDGNNWIKVRDIEGAGNSSTLISYESIDEHPFQGSSFYRLKQTDFDDNYTYSEIKNIFITDSKIKVFPNPVRDHLTIESVDISSLKIILLDMMNKQIESPVRIQSNQYIINTSYLPSGVYFLIVERDNIFLKKEKIIIQK